MAWNNLVGQQFGYLTVLEKDLNYKKEHNLKGRDAYWKCLCICGNIKTANGNGLKSGRIKSCGCLHKEKHFKDITNQRFGKLVAKEKIDKKGSYWRWRCQCDCGSQTLVISHSLLCGNTLSCGCLKSKGEQLISSLLIKNNINFVTQKSFSDCFVNSGHNFRFDFYINESFLLEFDGQQHYEPSNSGWNTKENYQKIKANDEFKNNYCKENNIPLKRIPYWKLKTLTIEDIMGDEFLIKFY